MATFDPVSNFAVCEVDGLYSATATAVDLATGDGGLLPAAGGSVGYPVVWWESETYPNAKDDPKVEMVRIGARTGDALSSITRGVEGTTPSTKSEAGKTYSMALCFSKGLYDQICAILNNALGGREVATGAISSGAVAYAAPVMNLNPEGPGDDTLHTISGGTAGDWLAIYNNNSTYTITVSDSNNIAGASNQYPRLKYSTGGLLLRHDGTDWRIMAYWPSVLMWRPGPALGTDIETDRRVAIADPGLTPSVHSGAQVSIDMDDDVALSVNRENGDGTVIAIRQDGTAEGSISVTGNTTLYNAFVGSHFTQIRDLERVPPRAGVLISTGEPIPVEVSFYVERVNTPEGPKRRRHFIPEGSPKAGAGWTWETRSRRRGRLTYTSGTTTPADPRVYGVFAGRAEKDSRSFSAGRNGEPLYQVAAVGLGMVRVTDTGGDIAAGDYLQSSARLFEAERQVSASMLNSTLGKAIVPVVWALEAVDPQLGYKWKKIPATLHCG